MTGVVVNEKPSIDRATLKRFRALLFQIDKDGPEGKQWGNGSLFNSIEGYANFVAMINPEKGLPLQKTVVHLKRKYNEQVKPGKVLDLNKKMFRAKAGAGEVPREGWWEPTQRPEPILELTQQQQKERQKHQKAVEKSAKNSSARAAVPARAREGVQRENSRGGCAHQEVKASHGSPNTPVTVNLGKIMLFIALIIIPVLLYLVS